MGLLGATLLAAAVGVGAPPAVDHAKLFPRLSADRRRVAYVREAHPDRSEIAVLDTRTGERLSIPAGPACEPVDLGAGLVLIGCYLGGPSGWRLHSATDGTQTAEIRGLAYGEEPAEVGRHWVNGRTGCGGGRDPTCEFWAQRWRTGERVPYWVDVDAAAPHRRRDGVRRGGPRFAGGLSRREPLRLVRRERSVRLSSCHDGCEQPVLGGGVAAWIEGWSRVRTYSLRTGRRRAFGFRRYVSRSRSDTPLWHVLTRHALVVQAGTEREPAWDARVVVIRLARVR